MSWLGLCPDNDISGGGYCGVAARVHNSSRPIPIGVRSESRSNSDGELSAPDEEQAGPSGGHHS